MEDICKDPSLAAQKGIRRDYLGIDATDSFLCWIVQFFQNTLILPVGFVSHIYTLTLANAFMAIASVEGSRATLSKTIISWVPLFGVLGQFGGISIIVPLLWIPFYAYKSSNLAPLNNTVSAARVLSIPLSLFLGVVLIQYNIMFPTSLVLQQNSIAIFMIAPAFPTIISLVLAPILAPFIPSSLSRSRAAVRATHAAMAFGNLVIHFYLLNYMIKNRVTLADFLSILDVPSALVSSTRTFSSPVEQASVLCGQFLLVDFIALTAAMSYWIVLESGIVPALATLAASLVLSPGVAVPLYAAWREGTLDDVQEKKDK